MNFIFTWILDRFGFVPKATLEFPICKKVATKRKTVAKKSPVKTVRKKA